MEFICSAQHDLLLLEEITRWWMAAAELHVNATHYTQYPALKSVYEKDQSVLLCLVSYFPPMSL